MLPLMQLLRKPALPVALAQQVAAAGSASSRPQRGSRWRRNISDPLDARHRMNNHADNFDR
jgi:hypothetical protein